MRPSLLPRRVARYMIFLSWSSSLRQKELSKLHVIRHTCEHSAFRTVLIGII